MESKDVFEETRELELKKLKFQTLLENVKKECVEVMEECPHEIVFMYRDNSPRMMMVDGHFYCPACGKMLTLFNSKDIMATAFSNSKVIPLTNLSLLGSKNLYNFIRNEVYKNMDEYYSSDSNVSYLSNRMETLLKEENFTKSEKILVKKKR